MKITTDIILASRAKTGASEGQIYRLLMRLCDLAVGVHHETEPKR